MSLLKIIVLFLVGFLRGFVEEYTGEKLVRRVPDRRRGGERSFDQEDTERPAYTVPCQPRGYDFHDHMNHLADATGKPLQSDSDSVKFTTTVRGHAYGTLLFPDEGDVVLGSVSLIDFPLGRIPEEVQALMRNTTPEHCRYEVTTVNGKSRACAITRLASAELTPSVFKELLANTVAAVCVLDDAILKYGLARQEA